MISALRQEINRLLLGLLLLLALGFIFDQPLLPVCIGLLAYLGWTFYNIKRLIKWFTHQGKHVPETYGIWDDIFYQLYQLYQRQRKAKRKLTAILGHFQESTQALPYAAIVLNQNMEIEWFNSTAKRLFDLHKNFDIGQRIDNLIRFPKFISYLSTENFSDDLELDLDNRSVRLTITPYGNNQYLVGAHDITQRRKLEVMRRDFTANASHELRTPLTVISGYVEAMQDCIEPRLQQPLQHIHQQTERMESLINDLMALSRLETSDLPSITDSVDVEPLMQQVYNEIKLLDQNKHQLIVESIPAKICGNRDDIRTALVNLMTNALRYSSNNTAIRLSNIVNEDEICIMVEDQGIGIAEEHIPRLTERFYRVDPGRSREQGGTGLGLAIVKHILDRHHARLEIDSNRANSEYNGSIFRCYFPR